MSRAIFEIYPDRAAWLEARRDSIGSSDLVSLLAPECVPGEPRGWLSIWAEKNPAARARIVKDTTESERAEKMRIRFAVGHALEPIISDALAERHVLNVVDPGDFTITRSPDLPGVHTSLDRLVFSGDADARYLAAFQAGVEAAMTVAFNESGASFAELKSIDPFAQLKGDYWSKEEPGMYPILQGHHSLSIPGFEHIDGFWVAGIIGYGGDPERDFLSYWIPRNEELCAMIRETWDRFLGYVRRDEEPPLDGYEDTQRAIRALYPAMAKEPAVSITLPPSPWIERQNRYDAIGGEMERLGREKQQIANEVEYEMAQRRATVAVVPVSPDKAKATRWQRQTVADGKPKLCPKCSAEVAPGRRGYVYFQAH